MDQNRLIQIDRRRITFAALLVLLFGVTEPGRNVYRPYIYSHGIFDFWIADTIGNFTGTMTVIFFELAVMNPPRKLGRIMLGLITLGLIGYEFAQCFSPKSVVDWRDMIGTLIAGLISWGVYELIGNPPEGYTGTS